MTTLDGVQRKLTSEMLLITDGGGPVAVAGVMGGLESEVTESTVDILLEAANFDNISVRRTASALKLSSEAAQRFGKGVDRELTLVALRRAAELMRELAGGVVATGLADAYPRPAAPQTIDLKVAAVERVLGISLSAERIAEMLEALGFACEVVSGDTTLVRTTVPSFRFDVSIPADLCEEVARMYGYDRLPTTLMEEQIPPQARDLDLDLEELVRDILVGCGLTEIISYSMTNLDSVARLTPEGQPPDGEGYLRVANPLSREHEYLRQTLLNTTLEMVARNLRFLDRVAIFEIGAVYLPAPDQTFPEEPRRLSIALSGRREPRSWLSGEDQRYDFYDLKGIVETLCGRLGVDDVRFSPIEHGAFHPGRVAGLAIGGRQIGVLGEVHPTVRTQYELPDQAVCLLELDLEALLAAAQPAGQFSEISRMPALRLDLAVIVEEGVPTDQIGALIRQAGGSLLVTLVLFDVFRGKQIGEGRKSLAYSLTFQAMDRTLTTEEAVAQRERIVGRLRQELGAEIRS